MYQYNQHSSRASCSPEAIDLPAHLTVVEGIAQRWAPPAERDDVVQEVALRALGQSRLPCDPRRLRAYLGSIARHVCVDWYRRRRRRLVEPLGEFEPGVEDRHLAAALAQNELDVALAEVDDGERYALLAHHRDDLTHRDIADSLGVTPATVALRLHRARRRLQARRREV